MVSFFYARKEYTFHPYIQCHNYIVNVILFTSYPLLPAYFIKEYLVYNISNNEVKYELEQLTFFIEWPDLWLLQGCGQSESD